MSETHPPASEILRQGLWSNNAGLVQLLGLCPLLAVSNTLINALGLGLATVGVLVLTNTLVSLLRPLLLREIRIPIFVLVIAASVTIVELAMNAWMHELHRSLGIFLPLIITNCVIIARAESFASRNRVLPSALDGLATGLGFLLVLLCLGAVRELLGQGTLLAQAHQLFGEGARDWTLRPLGEARGLLIASLPPGAFIVLALLIAGRNAWNARAARRSATASRVIDPVIASDAA